MVSLDNLEYSYHDQTMSEMGLTPSEVEITIPSYVLRDRTEEIEYWDNQMTLAMLGIEARPLPTTPQAGFLPDVEAARALLHDGKVRAIVLVLFGFWQAHMFGVDPPPQ